MAVKSRILERPTWKSCRGPISAVLLSLHRVGWSMSAAHVLVDDQGFHIDLLRTAPLDVKAQLRSGIQRWQARKILSHLPQAGSE
eukprot:476790-Pyramimonas_sp.AAC.1